MTDDLSGREGERKTRREHVPGGDALDWLIEMLVCPVDRASLLRQSDVLTCTQCGRTYAIEDGIPVMIPEQVKNEQTF